MIVTQVQIWRALAFGIGCLSFSLASFAEKTETAFEKQAIFLPNPELNVKSYRLELRSPSFQELKESKKWQARLKMQLTLLKNSSKIQLHSNSETIAPVKIFIDKKEAKWKFTKSHVLTLVAAKSLNKGPHAVEIIYDINSFSESRHGLFFRVNDDKPEFEWVAANNWPYYLRDWVPSHDHPSDPATFEVLVAAPKELSVISIGKKIEGENFQNSWLLEKPYQDFAVTHWKMAASVPSYSLNLNIGKLSLQSAQVPVHTSKDQMENIELQMYQVEGTSETDADLNWPLIKKLVAEALDFYTKNVGPYVFEKVAYSALRPGSYIEYPSLISGTGSPVHELVHQWFGDSVMIKHWGDLWLSEGITKFAEGLLSNFQYPDFKVERPNVGGEFRFEALTADPNEIVRKHEAVYNNGARVLQDLRFLLLDACKEEPISPNGQEIGYAMLRMIFTLNKGKNLTTEALVKQFTANINDIANSANCALSKTESEGILSKWKQNWKL